MKNPIEILAETSNSLTLKASVYAVRPLVGRINANLVTQASRLLREQLPDAASGIDGFNDRLSAVLAERESTNALESMGLSPRLKPYDAIRKLLGVKQDLLDASEIAPTIKDLVDDLPGTLQYMQQPRTIISSNLESLAAQVDVPVGLIAKALEDEQKRNIDNLKASGPQILEVIRSIEPQSVGSFDDLDAKLKASIYAGVDAVLSKQLQYAISSLVRGGDESGSIPMLREAQRDLKAWARAAAAGDPDLALALVA